MTATANDSRTDWFAVICDIGRRGYPSQTIADAVGVPKSTLLGWKQGSEPKHGDGEALIGFWCRVMDRPRSEVPRVSCADWRSYHADRVR